MYQVTHSSPPQKKKKKKNTLSAILCEWRVTLTRIVAIIKYISN